jgi:hypothetical protein
LRCRLREKDRSGGLFRMSSSAFVTFENNAALSPIGVEAIEKSAVVTPTLLVAHRRACVRWLPGAGRFRCR